MFARVSTRVARSAVQIRNNSTRKGVDPSIRAKQEKYYSVVNGKFPNDAELYFAFAALQVNNYLILVLFQMLLLSCSDTVETTLDLEYAFL